jgi:cyclophilin family peptidyl-prolyl cis-trans isomerase
MHPLRHALLALCLILFVGEAHAQQTLVRFRTILGDFEAVLYDQQTPVTVSNFLAYVDAGTYNNTFIHRSVPNFVIQGGGFTAINDTIYGVNTFPMIVNEAQLDNRRGTLAMARSDDANSATSQWFINLVDNSFLNPSTNSAGYAVFGRVLGEGMSVVDQLAAMPAYDASEFIGPTFTELPLLNPSLSLTNFLWVTAVERISFGVAAIQPNGGVTVTGTDTPYVLQRSYTLTSNDWVDVVTTNTTGNVIDLAATNQPRAFYRLVIPD